MNINNNTALITGASSGIGKKLAERFAKDGYNVVLVARRKETLETIATELENTYKIQATSIALDLSTPKCEEILQSQLKDIPISILVNNAGFGNYGEFISSDLEKNRRMMALNMVTLTQLTRVFLPYMKKHNSGKILNVASTAAFQPGPYMAVYFATKAYVLSFTEALQQELSDTNITVTALCPGPTKTEFAQRASENTSNSISLFSNAMDVETVVDTAYTGLMKGKKLIIPGVKNKLLLYIQRITPRRLTHAIMKKIMQ